MKVMKREYLTEISEYLSTMSKGDFPLKRQNQKLMLSTWQFTLEFLRRGLGSL